MHPPLISLGKIFLTIFKKLRYDEFLNESPPGGLNVLIQEATAEATTSRPSASGDQCRLSACVDGIAPPMGCLRATPVQPDRRLFGSSMTDRGLRVIEIHMSHRRKTVEMRMIAEISGLANGDADVGFLYSSGRDWRPEAAFPAV
jgi:hypothetical protein